LAHDYNFDKVQGMPFQSALQMLDDRTSGKGAYVTLEQLQRAVTQQIKDMVTEHEVMQFDTTRGHARMQIQDAVSFLVWPSDYDVRPSHHLHTAQKK
jgi:hypothetical protein